MTEQEYKDKLQKDYWQENERKKMWKWFALILLAIVLYDHFKSTKQWTPDIDSNKITFTRTHFFGKTETHICQWRRNDDGDWGWCTKDKDGSWYIFLQESYDDYDNGY